MKIINNNILYKIIKPRCLYSHKDDFGKILVIGGNLNMAGAIIFSGSAAVHAGAGLVTIASYKENLSAIHSVIPEAMFIDFNSLRFSKIIKKMDVIVVGPGLGQDINAIKIIDTLFNNVNNQYVIIDGSAITLIALNKYLMDNLPSNNIIFTPHAMEWERLSGIKINLQDNVNLNQKKAALLKATVILKKHHSEIYFPNNKIYKLNIGGPEMATGGMGDTLTGILAAFLGQFEGSFEDKVQAAVYLHSKIADELANEKYVVLPEDIISHLQFFMKKYECIDYTKKY